jgi:hypothetical protein
MKRTFYLAAAALAIALIAPAANSQQRDLDLRFHVPFQFSIGNKTFAAGDYQITYPIVLHAQCIESRGSYFSVRKGRAFPNAHGSGRTGKARVPPLR